MLCHTVYSANLAVVESDIKKAALHVSSGRTRAKTAAR
jgi:hypothetical protein